MPEMGAWLSDPSFQTQPYGYLLLQKVQEIQETVMKVIVFFSQSWVTRQQIQRDAGAEVQWSNHWSYKTIPRCSSCKKELTSGSITVKISILRQGNSSREQSQAWWHWNEKCARFRHLMSTYFPILDSLKAILSDFAPWEEQGCNSTPKSYFSSYNYFPSGCRRHSALGNQL